MRDCCRRGPPWVARAEKLIMWEGSRRDLLQVARVKKQVPQKVSCPFESWVFIDPRKQMLTNINYFADFTYKFGLRVAVQKDLLRLLARLWSNQTSRFQVVMREAMRVALQKDRWLAKLTEAGCRTWRWVAAAELAGRREKWFC